MRGKKLVQLEETHRPTRQNCTIILFGKIWNYATLKGGIFGSKKERKKQNGFFNTIIVTVVDT